MGTAAIVGADGDIVFGRLPAELSDGVTLRLDGRADIAVTGAFPVCDSAGRMQDLRGQFRVRVPDVTEETALTGELVHQGTCLDRKTLSLRPVAHVSGLIAHDILSLHRFPLVAVNGIALQGGTLDVTGLALAPDGDPARVSVRVDGSYDGYRFLYPLPSAGARATYWYWPNSDYATFKLSIDLAARRRSDAAAYELEFRFASPDAAPAAVKNTFHVPKHLAAYESFPDLKRLRRVQHFENLGGVAVRGYSDATRLLTLARSHGLRGEHRLRVLDWGCGHGRVVRHLPAILGRVAATGADIDADNIAWARENLSAIDFHCTPLMPPTEFPDHAFDLVYGISVMTHLTRPVQIAWLQEIRRILAPGGLALLTFAGDAAVAFASQHLTPDWIADYRARGMGADLPSKDLVGVIEDPDYYRNVKVGAPAVAALCGEFFQVRAVLECMFGYQDLAVLRRP